MSKQEDDLTVAGFSSNFLSENSETKWNLLLNPTSSFFGRIVECDHL